MKIFLFLTTFFFLAHANADIPGFMECSFSNDKKLVLEMSFGSTKQVNVQKAQYMSVDQSWATNNEGEMNQVGESNLQFLQTTAGFTLVNTGGGSISAISVSYTNPVTKYLGALSWEANNQSVSLMVSDMVISYKGSATLKEGTHYMMTTGTCTFGKTKFPEVPEFEPGEL